jgi:hypothetical protein
MASLKLLLGLIPATSKIEQAEKALIAEFEKLQSFTGSDKLARYTELDGLVNSSSFIEKKKEIEGLRYKDSEEYDKEKEFLQLQKAKDIVLYFKTAASHELKKFRDLEGSEKISAFEKLESFIKSDAFREKQKMKPVTFKDTDEYSRLLEFKALRKDPEVKAYFKAKQKGKEAPQRTKVIEQFEELSSFVKSQAFLTRQNMKPVTFKDSDEYKKLLEYQRLKGSPEIKEYYRFGSSKEYANYLNTHESKRIARYGELKEYVATSGFRERKVYLLDKKRFEKTEMFRQLGEYAGLKKDPDILWYFKVKDSDKFDILKQRELTFSDDFTGDGINRDKWLTNYYWGDKLLGDRYSVEGDLQAFTEKDNFEIRNSVLKITTRPQRVTGKVWTADRGFSTREFGYTSGIISSGAGFRQKYGIFSAKIKLGSTEAKNAFWLLSDKITPHIDICRTAKGKVWFDIFTSTTNLLKTTLGSRYAGDYFIFTLEWTPNTLTWLINNTEVFTQTSDIPHEPMFLNISGGLDKPISGATSMEIDWVRVYKAK